LTSLPAGDSHRHDSDSSRLDLEVAEEARFAKRKWQAFRITAWGLAGVGAVLMLVGAFWPGALGLLGASVVWIAWDIWARREQARFDALAKPMRDE
jgi:hypothetical protein